MHYVSPQTPVHLLVALRHRNVHELKALFERVSNPRSPDHRRFVSHAELGVLVSPSTDSVKAVTEFLQQAGARRLQWTVNREYVRASLSVSQAELLFQCKIVPFRHRATGRLALRSIVPYTVPAELAPHLDLVFGLAVHRLPRIKPRIRASLGRPTLDNSPVVVSNHQGSSQLQLFFAPRCSNGAFTASDCTDQPNQRAIIMVTIAASPLDRTLVSGSSVVTASFADVCRPCEAFPEPWFGLCNGTLGANNITFCLVNDVGLTDYVPYQSYTYSVYADDSSSAPSLLNITTLPWTTTTLLKRLYNIPASARGQNPRNSMAVIEFLGENYAPSDLDMFLLQMGAMPAPKITIDGPNDPTQPGGEASLDIQYITGLAPNISTLFYLNNDLYNNQEPFAEWLVAMINSSQPPLVQSVSYGDQEYTLSGEYMARVNLDLMKLGTMGVSVLFASGDDGVGGGDARTNASFCATLNPSFPSSSPYVTAVGGTQLSAYRSGICGTTQPFGPSSSLQFDCSPSTDVAEVVSSCLTGSRITSGGGFSTYSAQPAYQQAAVQSYLTQKQVPIPPLSMFNASNRAYPDVSAQAHNFIVYLGGQPLTFDGTSGSTPVFAAMIALINDELLTRTGRPLGFLNGWLYAVAANYPEAFTDIVYGDNRCTAVSQICCEWGFWATSGWDAATGLGVPVFDRLRDAAMDLS